MRNSAPQVEAAKAPQAPQPVKPPEPPAPFTPQDGGAPSPTPQAPCAVVINVDALRARGAELSNQLRSVQGRRDALARDMRRASDASMPGLQKRLDVLDQRLVQLEQDIRINGQLIAQGAGCTIRPSAASINVPFIGPMPPGNVTAISIVFTIFVLCPIALAAARLLWKRGNRPVVTNAQRDADLRMERVEQAVDTIAVEIERISEGQRFVTQLLARPAAQPIPVAQASAEPLRVALDKPLAAPSSRDAR